MLRDFIQADIPEVITIVNHSKFSGYPMRFRPGKIFQDVTCYIEEAINAQRTNSLTKCRELFRLAITLKEDPKHVIGCCVFDGWNKLSEGNDQIGYFIHPEYQGHGYATEAIRHLVATYFLQYPDRNVDAIVHPSNLASRKVLEKLGFAQLGKKSIDVHGAQEPRLIFSLNIQAFERINHSI